MKRTLLVLGLLANLACRPPESHDHDHDQDQAEAAAVIESSPKLGFRLAPLALRTLGIETVVWRGGPTEKIPVAALVYFQDEIGVYRLRDGWFRLIPLDHAEELQTGDSIAVRGAALLRVTDMSLFGDQPSGHHH